MSKTFYITTPIYYVNDVPHIGHAYTTIAADVLARYHRLKGDDVFFLTGLDEHGQKVQQAAQKAAMDPKAYCDRLAPQFQTLWKRLNISNDAFIRTTDPKHKAYVQKTLKVLYDKELIYRADYTGWYCTFDERFWTEKDVVNGLCPDCKRPVEQLSESNYFFKMGQYQDRLVKYILTTHAVYWSTILMALKIPLPKTIFAHGWWTVSGEKMSKSRGNVVDPHAVVDEFGADAFRYFLLREVPFGQDGDFSREALIGRINTDLANDLGNLLNRSLTMIERFAKGIVPEPLATTDTELDNLLQQTAQAMLRTFDIHLGSLEFNRALEAIWSLVQLGNQYIDKSAPWTLAKKPEDKPRLNTVLYNAAETLRFLCLALYPFMPQAAEEMKRQLGLVLNFSKPLLSSEITWGGVLPGTEIAKGSPLFPRIDTTKTQGDARVKQDQQPAPSPTDQITIDEFRKVSLRVGLVIAAERVPKSTRLLKLQVDIGTERRQVVAGIGTKYAPEDLVGKRVVFVANLKPAKLMGVESQGMVLAAGEDEVTALLTTMDDVPPGSKIK